MKLYAPVEEGAVLGDAGGALLGGSSSNNVVPLGGHHGNRQALLDGSAASSVAVQAVGDGGNDLVGAFRGSGKKASGHDTVSVVSGWSSLTPSLLWLGRVLLLGLVPRHNDWVVPGPSKPALCGLCRSYALVRRLTAALVRGRVLLPGGTKFFAGFLLRQIRRFAGYVSGPGSHRSCGITQDLHHDWPPSTLPLVAIGLGYSISALSNLNRSLLFWNEMIIAK